MHVPYVLRRKYIVRHEFLTWHEQDAIYQEHPERWEKLAIVCEELHSDSIKWLNAAYGEIIRVLGPFLGDENYQRLWGRDTENHGRHVRRESGPRGPQDFPSGDIRPQ